MYFCRTYLAINFPEFSLAAPCFQLSSCVLILSIDGFFLLIVFLQVMVLFTEVVVQRCPVKKVFLEILQNLQKNTCARVSFLMKKKLWHRCFPVNFVKFLRTPFFIEHLWWLLLQFMYFIYQLFYTLFFSYFTLFLLYYFSFVISNKMSESFVDKIKVLLNIETVLSKKAFMRYK